MTYALPGIGTLPTSYYKKNIRREGKKQIDAAANQAKKDIDNAFNKFDKWVDGWFPLGLWD